MRRKRYWNATGLTLDEIDLFEYNEAFAAQAVAVVRELDVDQDKVNVNGGAIAIGHPIGASVPAFSSPLLYEMKGAMQNAVSRRFVSVADRASRRSLSARS